jgi:hypothetical protein
MRLWIALLALVVAAPAEANYRMRYSRERGGDCTVMIPYYGPQALWIARFAGGRPLDTSADRVFSDFRDAQVCFFEHGDCERYLRRVTAAYPMPPGYAYCLALGAAPRAPLRSAPGAVVKP